METEEQMEMAFMQDDGMDVDPVSGNEVPPGSMANEVRDDIPAQLSEGEYVVPADVVRYFGVKFFEDLRSQAKMGMSEMEADGRIGGEPIEVEDEVLVDYDDSDLSEDEIALLNEVTGMAMGGMARKTVYAADGADIDPYQPQFSPGMASMFAPGFLLDQTMGVAPITEVTLYGPNGETVKLNLPTDQAKYDELIAQGYTTTPPSAITVQPQTTQAPTQAGSGSGSGGDGPKPPETERKPWYDGVDWTSTEIAKPGIIEDLITTMVPGVGYVVSMNNVANQYAKANILEASGDATGAAALRENIDAYIKGKGLGARIAKTAFGQYADGDWKTIEYLESIGIDVPKGIKDEDMVDYIKQLSNDPDMRDKVKRSISGEGAIVAPKVDKEKLAREAAARKAKAEAAKAAAAAKAAQKQANVAVSLYASQAGKKPAGAGEYNKPIVTQKSIQQTKDIVSKAADKADTAKNLQRTTAKIKDITSGRNTSGQVGFKSGGLMKKKNKK
jgi:hypothetical protein